MSTRGALFGVGLALSLAGCSPGVAEQQGSVAGRLTGTMTTTLVAKNSGKCVDVPYDAADAGLGLQQWDCLGNEGQSFTFGAQSDGSYVITTSHGLCFDSNGSWQVAQAACNDSPAQRWAVTAQAGGTYLIANVGSGSCLNIAYDSSSNGLPLITYACGVVDNELFTMAGFSTSAPPASGGTTSAPTFGQPCAASTTCSYEGAVENQPAQVSCASGTLTITSATYGQPGATESCLAYAQSVCNGQTSCTVTFSNATCAGDPDYGIVKAGSLVATCASGITAPSSPSTACAGGPPSATTPPSTIDTSCFQGSFIDDFNAYDISSGTTDDGKSPGEKWFNGTEQCCMSTSDGSGTAMYPTPDSATGQAVNPYALIPGGGLAINARKQDDAWFSGVMTSVDGNHNGFSQTYGYFEMSAQLPKGTGTWPSFWMLSMPGYPNGEIDIFEQYGCNPPLDPYVEDVFHFTLHDWEHNTSPFYDTTPDLGDLTAAYHRYGLLWNASYMALYFDGKLVFSTPTPDVMKGTPYYLLADMGIGGGWDTTETPNPATLLIKYIHAYTVPGF